MTTSQLKSEACEHAELAMDKKNLQDKHEAFESCLGLDPEQLRLEKRLVRKLDMTLMPAIWLLYLFNYLDRNNIAQTELSSFKEDLGLNGTQFNVAVSILNVGYVLMQIPSNMILTRVRPSIYIPLCVMLWSCVSSATAGVTSYSGLVCVRFFLGIVEAPFFPGAFFMLSSWYTRRELAKRGAILISGQVLATAVSGLIAAGIFAGLEGAHGLAGWQWLFIIEGTASFAIALGCMFILPDFPHSKTGSTRWLFTEAERKLAVERLSRDRVSEREADHSVMYGLKLAVTDYRTWVFALMICSNHSAYGFNNFYPSIVKGFGLGSRTITLVCTAPPYLLAAVIAVMVAFSSDRFQERGSHISIPLSVAIIGFIITVSTLNVPARYFASFLFIGGSFSVNALVYTWASATLNQTPEKRACATALINTIAQLGNIWSPYFFRPQDSPRYILAMLLMMAFSVIALCTALFMKVDLRKGNEKLRRAAEEDGTLARLYTL